MQARPRHVLCLVVLATLVPTSEILGQPAGRRPGIQSGLVGQPPSPARQPEQSSLEAQARARSLVERGDQFFRQQKYSDAISNYKRAIRTAQDHVAAQFRLAAVYVATGYYSLAVNALRRGLNLKPSWPQGDFDIKTLYGSNELARQGHLEVLEKAARSKPDDAELQLLLGFEYHFGGEREKARRHFERALGLTRTPGFVLPFLRSSAPVAETAKPRNKPAAAVPPPPAAQPPEAAADTPLSHQRGVESSKEAARGARLTTENEESSDAAPNAHAGQPPAPAPGNPVVPTNTRNAARARKPEHAEGPKPSRIPPGRTADDVEASVRLEQSRRIEVQGEMAALSSRYNEFMKTGRFGEAEWLALRAAAIDPSNLVSEAMIWQARFARNAAESAIISDRHQQGFLRAMQSVDEAAIPFDDRVPLVFPDARRWREITKVRRSSADTDRDKKAAEPEPGSVDADRPSDPSIKAVRPPL